MDDTDRFWAKVDRQGVDDCWPWTGAKIPEGYGHLRWDGRVQGAHRVSYQIHVGPIPSGLEIDHLCRNPSCVNPDHLRACTHAQNLESSQNVTAVNSRKTCCPKCGGPYTMAKDGTRFCRPCKNAWNREYRKAST